MSDIELYLPGILLAMSAFSLALMSPGPNVLAIIGTSIQVGRPQSIAMAVGIGSGTFLWVLLAVVGFTTLVSQFAFVMMALKVLGGAYLIWLGFKSLKSASKAKLVETSVVNLDSHKAYFLRGLAVQMTNPKSALANLAIASVGVHAGAPMWVGASIVLGCTAISLIAHVAYAIAFSTQTMVSVYARGRRVLEAAMGTFFCVLGLRLLTDRS